jgi:drug/metabolite transporter (DMT)-like permease
LQKKQPSPLSIWLALISVYIAWGSTYLAIRFAVESIPPYLMAGARFLIAGAILYAFRRLSGDPAPKAVHWRSAAVVGTLLLVLANGWVVYAEQRVPSSIAALMVASVPLWLVLLDALRPGGRRPGWVVLAGVLTGLVGLIILAGPGSLGGQPVDVLGAVLLTLASISWAAGSLYSRKASLPASALLGTGMEMLVGGVLLLLVGTALGEWSRFDLAAVSTRSLLSLGYLVVAGSLVGFASYTWLLRNAPTPLVSTYAYVNPIVAIFIGNLLAGEPISPRVLLAAAVIIGSVVLITLAQPVKKQPNALAPAPAPGGDY